MSDKGNGKVSSFLKHVCAFAVIVAVAIAPVYIKVFTNSDVKQKLAVNVVKLLYDFGTSEQLEAQQERLKNLVTEDVYNQLTYDNDERRLNTYLKFCESSSTVELKKVTDDYVVYSLDCATIDPERTFVFMYRIEHGKITFVRESELIDFIEGDDKW